MHKDSHMHTRAVRLLASHMHCLWRIGKVIRPALPLQTEEKEEKDCLTWNTQEMCGWLLVCVCVCVCVCFCVRACMDACMYTQLYISMCMHVSGDLRSHPKGWWPRSCNSLLWLFHWLDYSYNYRQLRHSASDWLAQQAKLHTVILWIQHLSKAYPPIFIFGLE